MQLNSFVVKCRYKFIQWNRLWKSNFNKEFCKIILFLFMDKQRYEWTSEERVSEWASERASLWVVLWQYCINYIANMILSMQCHFPGNMIPMYSSWMYILWYISYNLAVPYVGRNCILPHGIHRWNLKLQDMFTVSHVLILSWTPNIIRTFVGNNIVYHLDAVGTSPVDTAPTTSSLLT